MMKLPDIFQNGMTLQCEKPVHIWGECDCRETIRVTINGSKVFEQTVEAGSFEFCIPPQPPAENARLVIGEVCLEQVDFGEVWIAGGQSNMEFLLRYERQIDEVRRLPEDEHLRYYDVGKYCFEGEKEEGLSSNGFWDRWMHFEPETLEHFSAAGFAFANELRHRYKRPIAVVGCNWGGTTASAWLDENLLTGNLSVYMEEYKRNLDSVKPERYFELNRRIRGFMASERQREFLDELHFGGERFQRYQERTKNNTDSWEEIGFHGDELKIMMQQTGPHDKNHPGGLYHMMQQRIAGYTARGVIWYQGESDDSHAVLYAELFTALIGCWRKDWNDELPFLFVQLAPFGSWRQCSGKKFPILRKQQEMTAEKVKNTYMVSISDLGDEFDIHPKEKQAVGYRLALKAEKYVYGEDVLCEYPKGETLTVGEGSCTIGFMNGKGLHIRGEALNAMQLVIDGQAEDDWLYQIRDDNLVLINAAINSKKSIKIQFAQTPFYHVNLYNEAGIPSVPFELHNQ